MFFTSFILKKDIRAVYIIGDSTVCNCTGDGYDYRTGWGSYVKEYFDTNKISIRNCGIAGRSSRTFITEGFWDKIVITLKKNDYVIMQFGHNDSDPLDDTVNARGSIHGADDESRKIYNPVTKRQELVHTYGWYLGQYIKKAKIKGAISIVCSPIRRLYWQDSIVI